MPNSDFDQNKARMAVVMVSHLFPPGRMPQPNTDISQWTQDMAVQISWSAQLNGPLKDGAALYHYGWHRVTASEIGDCKYMRDLVGLVYERLVAPPAQRNYASGLVADFMNAQKDFMRTFGSE